MPETKDTGRLDNESDDAVVERLGHTLDGWRARIDELWVQFDLAEHEVRDQVRKRIDVTENVYLAARSRFSDVRRDATSNVNGLCDGTEKLLIDLRQVYDSAGAALRRGREG
jgi:hypothetical protein